MEEQLNRYYPFLKRGLDIIVGFFGCFLTLCAYVMIKLVYLKHGDTHPLIFKQQRVGLGGKTVVVYKFRSMVPNAEALLEKILAEDEVLRQEYQTHKKLKNDPRVTRFGNQLRRYSIDEFPQFFNVLIGNMTLVGPRPYLPREIAEMGDAYPAIITCKPALTGPWQVSGRSDISFEERLRLDVDYAKEKDLKKDWHILKQTFLVVFNQKGAR